jgi:hypothetical protein
MVKNRFYAYIKKTFSIDLKSLRVTTVKEVNQNEVVNQSEVETN